MLYNLRYVLGDSLFLGAMKHYVSKWKFAHPYPEDFRQAIIEYTQADLNWFFDEWLETTKYIDYSIQKVKRIKNKNSDQKEYEITFRRIGRMQMPIDFTITTKDNQSYNYYIPNTWFVKDTTNKKVNILSKWYGWDLLEPTYKARITVPTKIKTVNIDPARILADADMTNNKWGNHGIRSMQFDHRISNLSRWDKQRNFLRPDVWYNSVDGIQPGIHAEGSYFGKYSYAATLWGNTTVGHWDNVTYNNKFIPIAFNTTGRYVTNKLWKQSSANDQVSYYGGIFTLKLGFEKILRKQDQRNPKYSKLFFYMKDLYNFDNYAQYLLYPALWGNGSGKSGLQNNSVNVGFFKNYFFKKGNGELTFTVRIPFINSDYNYSWINANSIHNLTLSKFEIRSRMFTQIGIGSYPRESVLMLSGANSEEMIDNKYTRAQGFVPTNWLGYGAGTNHFQYGGGLNLRGYSGYYAVEEYSKKGTDSLFTGYYSNSGASWNVEIDFDKFIKIKPKGIAKNLKLDTYLFSDMGILVFQKPTKEYIPGKFRMDAGVGTALTIRFTPYQINPLVVRFDMPLLLNTPPAGEEYFQFRYVLGINRTF
jgi:aminopeptidase N